MTSFTSLKLVTLVPITFYPGLIEKYKYSFLKQFYFIIDHVFQY